MIRSAFIIAISAFICLPGLAKKPGKAKPETAAPAPEAKGEPAPEAEPADGVARAADAVLVMALKGIGISESEAATVTTLVAELLAERSELKVVTPEDVEAMLEHVANKQSLGCEAEDACIAEMSKLANAKRALSGSLGKVGTKLVVTLNLVDAEKAASIGSASRNVASLGEVLEVMPELLAELFGWEGAAEATGPRFALPQGQELSFAVFDLKAQGIGKDIAENLTQVLAAELKKIQGASVIGRDDIVAMLQLEAQKEMLECTDETSCLAEIGGALGVDKLVVGSAGKLGESYVIALRLIDVNTVKVDNRVNEAMQGLEEQLIPAVRMTARRLVGIVGDEHPGMLSVTGSEIEAQVYLNDKKVGQLPMRPVPDLPPGRHSLRVSKDGYLDWRSDFYVEPGGVTPLWVQFEEEPLQWYQQWYVWAGVGAAVVAVVGISVGVYVDGASKLPNTPAGAYEL